MDHKPMPDTSDDPLIDPGAIEALRARIGQRVTISSEPYLTEASRDACRHWASAIGDRNPLWRDRKYARAWGYPDVLAPPTILYAFDRLSIGYRGGLPGVHSFFAGTNWRWHRPIVTGVGITADVVFKDLVEHESSFAQVSFQQISSVTFRNSDGELVATSQPWGFRVSRRAARDREGARSVALATYTRDQIDEIADAYEREQVRPDPLNPATLTVGERLPSIIRGPYTVTNVIAFEQAWGGLFVKAHGDWFEYLRRHPAAGLVNELGIPEPPEAVHWDREFARRAGVPQPYDYGPERVAWLGVLVTNWMGPTGFLQCLDVQVRKFNLVGDLTRLAGAVTAVQPAGEGRSLVSIDVEARNQRDERTAFGTAEVLLPSASD